MNRILFILFCALHLNSHSQGIKATILDAETKKPLPARIVITDDTGHVYNSYYSKLKGFFTEENGSFFQELKDGNYTLEVFRVLTISHKK